MASALTVLGSVAMMPEGAIAAELSEIRDRGYLIVGVKNNRPPLGFIDGEGNPAGFEIDIARRLAAELLGDPAAIEFVPVSNVERVTAVLEDRVDIAIAAITITAPRRRIISFSDPYYLDGVAFLTRQPNVQQLRHLGTGRIALLERSSAVAHVRYILPVARLVGVRSYAEGRQLLASGEVDAFAGDASVLSGWLLNDQLRSGDAFPFEGGLQGTDGLDGDETLSPNYGLSNYRLLESIISAEPLSVAIPKGTQYDSLRASVNLALRRWHAEGWLQERATAWGLPAESTQFLELSTNLDLES
ncbi:MAG: transporter substrate-binding domain-containing protein [Cyanobacteria bacterium J06598_3]